MGGSGGTGAPSLNKSDDTSGMFAGKCFRINEQVSIARVIVDCVTDVQLKFIALNRSPVYKACFLPVKQEQFKSQYGYSIWKNNNSQKHLANNQILNLVLYRYIVITVKNFY